MKKILLFALVVAILSGCKKSDVIKLNEDIEGSWSVESNTVEYYDAAGAKVFEESVDEASNIKEVSFKGVMATFITDDNEVLKSQYDLYLEDNKKYIDLYSVGIFDSHLFEIGHLSSSSMVWNAQYANVEYESEAGTATAAHAVLTIKLSKK